MLKIFFIAITFISLFANAESCVDSIKKEIPELNPTRRRIEDVLKQKDMQIVITGWIADYDGVPNNIKNNISDTEQNLKDAEYYIGRLKSKLAKLNPENDTEEYMEVVIDLNGQMDEIFASNEDLASYKVEEKIAKNKYENWLKKCTLKSEPNKIVQKAAKQKLLELDSSTNNKEKNLIQKRVKIPSTPSIQTPAPASESVQ